MANMMTFPNNFKDFLKQYSFKDEEEIYTNGSELIPIFRVEQAWEHYINNINQNLDNIYAGLRMIERNLEDIEELNDE